MPLKVDPSKIHAPQTHFTTDPEDKGVGFADQAKAALVIDNLAIAAGKYAYEAEDFHDDADFDAAEHLTDEELMDESYHDITSMPELEAKRKRKTNEAKARMMMREGPVNEYLMTGLATLTDPTSWIPLFGQVTKGKTAIQTGAKIAGRAAVENVLQEAALYSLQEDRSAGEMLTAGIFGGAMGFGLGSAAHKFSLGQKIAKEDIETAFNYLQATANDGAGSLSAAHLPYFKTPSADTMAVGHKALRGVARGLNKVGLASPALELATSNSPLVRDFVHQMFDTAIMTRGEKAGHSFGSGAALDTIIRGERDRMNHAVYTSVREGWKAAKKAGAKDRKKFERDVLWALNMGDKHPDPHVEKPARFRLASAATVLM